MKEKADDRKQMNRNRVVLDPEREREYALPLSGLFDELLVCDLEDGTCRTIFYTEGKSRLSVNRNLEEFQIFAQRYVHPEECGKFQSFFRIKHMRELSAGGQAGRMVFRQKTPREEYIWVEAAAVPSGEEGIMLCYVHDLGQEEQERYMLRQIVDRYVYRNCQWLICLDAERDAYDILQKNNQRIIGDKITGCYSRGVRECLGQYVVPEDREMFLRRASLSHVLKVLEQEGEFSFTYGTNGPDGEYVRRQLTYVYYDKPSRKILLMCRDITREYTEQCRQKKRLNDALLHARIDSLTSLYNRQAMRSKISAMLEDHTSPAAVLLFIDLDNFKSVNDTLGHPCGDKVLSCVSRAFRQVLRSSDIIGRVGGDEFVAFLAGVSSQEEAGECAGRLCQAVSRIPDLEQMDLELSCSIGGSVCPRDGTDYETLLRKADMAVYEAKRRGKNRYVFYGPDIGCPPGVESGPRL